MQTSFSLFFFKKKDKNVEMERFINVNIVYIKHGQKPLGPNLSKDITLLNFANLKRRDNFLQ